jgi:two-component system, LuxR family, response regulator FixJ
MSDSTTTICILDDDTSVLRSIATLLDSDGLTAMTFEEAEEFLDHAGSHPVPVAVLDVWMPKTDGLEVQARLNELSPRTKVIVMTGRDDPRTRVAALEGGAVAFLAKPFDDETFLAAVHQALAQAA